MNSPRWMAWRLLASSSSKTADMPVPAPKDRPTFKKRAPRVRRLTEDSGAGGTRLRLRRARRRGTSGQCSSDRMSLGLAPPPGYTPIVQRLYTSDLAMAMAVMVAIQLVGLVAVLQFINGL